MEEYDEFASDDFDLKGWINATVASHLQLIQASEGGKESNGHLGAPSYSAAGGGSGLETHLSGVATKLQAVSSSINASLEKSMVEIMVSVPRVVTEIERLEGAIKTLHAELGNLTGQLDEIDHGTNAHVETLGRLDLVKTNMGDCLQTLTEAASWNALVREVNARFGQDDLKGVAERLEAMVRSMDVLKDMPEAEDRAATLKELQEKLEALLKPKLLQVLKKERVGPLMEYAAMYRQLGRTDRFRAEYCRARAGAAHRRWFASATSLSGGAGLGVAVGGGVGGGSSRGEEAGATGSGLVTWLPPFLEYLQGSLMDERKKTSDLFGSDKSSAVLCELVVTAFQPLVGSFQKHLEATPWPDAVGLLTEVFGFVGQSLELTRGAGERDLLAVLLSATAAFRPMQDSFGALERRYLSAELWPLLEALGVVPEVPVDGLAAMAMAFTRRMEEISEVSIEGFGVVQEAAGRCIDLTAGYQGRDLLKQAAEAMSSFLKAIRSAAQQSRSLGKGVLVLAQPKSDKDDGVRLASNQGAQGRGQGGAPDISVEAFAREGDDNFDWQFLSGALVLLGAAGRCQQCFAILEKEIATALLRHRGALFCSSPPRLSGLGLTTNASVSSNGVFAKGGSHGRRGTASVELDGGSEEERVAFLRSALGRARLEEDRATRAETRASLMAIAEPSSALPGDVLPGPWRDLKALALEARSLVFDVCFAPVTSRLATLPSLTSWTEEEGEVEGDQGDGAWDYDTVPQPYMTQVGEHLLSLLQNLEPFASSDAFQDAAEPSKDLHQLTEPAWREFGAVLELGESELMLLETLGGAKPAEDNRDHHPLHGDKRHDRDNRDHGDHPGDEEHTAEHEDTEAARFCTAWLLCVGSGTVGCLLAKVLALPRLSERGVKHLEADLKYLSNVFHALDLSAPPVLEHVTSLVELGTEEAYGHLAQETVAGFGSAGAILVKLERRLAEVRGILSP